MCRILSISNFTYSKHEEIVDRFIELARTGVVMAGDPPGHEDGWGLAFYKNGGLIVHKSGKNLLEETNKVNRILRAAQNSPLMMLHLRKSNWTNSSSTRHAHPFQYKNTFFSHNGTVYDYEGLMPAINLPGFQKDSLDTEVFFCHFMSGEPKDLVKAFLQTVSLVKHKHKYSSLNCVFSDGKKLYAYRDFTKEPDYYSLYKACAGNSHLISSEPLEESISWEMMEKEEFLAIDLNMSAIDGDAGQDL